MTSLVAVFDQLNAKGTFKATIEGAHPPSFVADPDRLVLKKGLDHVWRASGSMRRSTGGSDSIHIEFPAGFVDDGREHKFPIKTPQDAGSAFALFISPQGHFESIAGELTASFKKGVVRAHFRFSAAERGSHTEINVRHGALALQIGVGSFDATFKNGPLPDNKDFKAQEVDIEDFDFSWPIPAFWQVRGQQQDDFPPIPTIFAVQIEKEGFAPGAYPLGKDDAKARVIFTRPGTVGPVHAHAGTLHIVTSPATGHAKGHFDGTFRYADGTEFTTNGHYDVYAPLSLSGA